VIESNPFHLPGKFESFPVKDQNGKIIAILIEKDGLSLEPFEPTIEDLIILK